MTVKENRNCPYCLSPVGPDDDRVRCPSCGVVHHAECWNANGKCSVYGCDGWAVWSADIAKKISPTPAGPVDVDSHATNSKPVARCISCGEPVKEGQIECINCRYLRLRDRNHWFDNCSGPTVLFIGGIVAIATAIVKALT